MSLSNDVFYQLTEANNQKGLPPLINVGYGKDVTIKQLAELVAITVGYEGELFFDKSKPDGTMRKLMDVSFLNALGWQAKVTLNEGLKSAYANFLEKGTTE